MIMIVFRVGEERRTLEAQLAKVANTHTHTNTNHILPHQLRRHTNTNQIKDLLMCCSPADGGEISNGKERRGAGFEDGSSGEGGQAAGERGEHFDHGDLDHGDVGHEVGDLEDDGSLGELGVA